MIKEQLKIMVICAHPDDADLYAGGVATKHAKLGNAVKFLSLTNGNAGHHIIGGAELAQRRFHEAQQSAKLAGIEYDIWDVDDGTLVPSIENRKKLIECIRDYQPNIILTHRLNDYHPDHRNTSILVQDASYLLTVPNICPLKEHMRMMPVIAYLSDNFNKPYPFDAHIAICIDDAIDIKVKMLDCHKSQLFEWLPYNSNNTEVIPTDDDERYEWIKKEWFNELAGIANKYRQQLIEKYGEEAGSKIKYAEVFEISEYGSSIEHQLDTLFPF